MLGFASTSGSIDLGAMARKLAKALLDTEAVGEVFAAWAWALQSRTDSTMRWRHSNGGRRCGAL